MIEIMLGMGGVIVVLIIAIIAMRATLSSRTKELEQARGQLSAVNNAYVAVDRQISKEKEHEAEIKKSVSRRSYFSDTDK